MTEFAADDLKLEIKNLIIDTLKITELSVEDIADDAPLFGGGNGIGLDSIDSIELIMALQRKYNVRIDDQNLARFILESVNTISDFIIKEKAK
ncbi:MAG: acyl carrier protein [Bacteroidetes bacterium]|jgi:acyl carrier protein|nr:acyl carrier protein [Bacteroidota bacterium]